MLESDELVEYANIFDSVLHDARSAHRVELRDGTWLRLDRHTPAGTYVLKDGRRIQLGDPRGYPRFYQHSGVPELSLFFAIRSTRRVGVFLSEDSAEVAAIAGLASVYVDTLRLSWSGPKLRVDRAAQAFEFPPDWYRRASVHFPLESRRRVRVVWVAYGAPGEVRQQRPSAQRGSYRVVPSGIVPARLRPATSDLLLRTGCIIGQAVLDLGARKVVATFSGGE